jgi:nucleoside-diphosphate-sugar epimerase
LRIALTGASGFLGRHVTQAALAEGYGVRALVRKRESVPLAPELEVQEGALDDPNALRGLLEGADVVIHLAAAGVRRGRRSLSECVEVNIGYGYKLVEAAAQAGVRFVIAAGSSLEYKGSGQLPGSPWSGPGVPQCSEESPLNDLGPYASSKAAGGLIIRATAAMHALPMWYLRLATLYGADDHRDAILQQAVRASMRGTELELTGGEQIREWLYVSDAARAILCSTHAIPPGVQVVNVGTGIGIKLADMLRRVVTLGGGDVGRILRFGARNYDNESHCIVMEQSRRKRYLNWEPGVSIDQGLRELVEAARND